MFIVATEFIREAKSKIYLQIMGWICTERISQQKRIFNGTVKVCLVSGLILGK